MREEYDYDQLYPGRFLKGGEFKGKDVTLTVTDVDIEELADEKGTPNSAGEKVRTKGVITFKETTKQLVLNRTNGECLKKMFGRKVREWVAKRVTLFPDSINAFGEKNVLAIRVRGSPDISADIEFDLRLPQKKAKKTFLKRTNQAAPAQAPAT